MEVEFHPANRPQDRQADNGINFVTAGHGEIEGSIVHHNEHRVADDGTAKFEPVCNRKPNADAAANGVSDGRGSLHHAQAEPLRRTLADDGNAGAGIEHGLLHGALDHDRRPQQANLVSRQKNRRAVALCFNSLGRHAFPLRAHFLHAAGVFDLLLRLALAHRQRSLRVAGRIGVAPGQQRSARRNFMRGEHPVLVLISSGKITIERRAGL